MIDLNRCLHVCCSDSAAGALKWAVRYHTGGRAEQITVVNQLGNAGPLLLLPKPAERIAWFAQSGFPVAYFLGFHDEPSALIKEWRFYWDQLTGWEGEIVFWFSGRNASNVSEWLATVRSLPPERRIHFVDVSSETDPEETAHDVGHVKPELLRNFFSKIELLDHSQRENLLLIHHRLSDESKGLRLFREGQLIEAPMTGLDDRICARIGLHWKKANLIGAQVGADAYSEGYQNIDYTFMLWRIEELQRTGRIERRGGTFDPTFADDPLAGEIRLIG